MYMQKNKLTMKTKLRQRNEKSQGITKRVSLVVSTHEASSRQKESMSECTNSRLVDSPPGVLARVTYVSAHDK